MAKIYLPDKQTKKWTQPNRGEIFGHMFATFNIDLRTNRGKMRVSPRTRIVTDNGDDADLGYPTAGVRSNASGTDQWWALCDGVLFKTSGTDPVSAFTQDAIASSPTDLNHLFSDIEDFEDKLIVSKTDDLHKLESGSWTTSWWKGAGELNQSALTAGIFHPVKKGFNKLVLVGDDFVVHTINENENVANSRLRFGKQYRVIWIRSGSDRYWIGLTNKYSGAGAVAEWDGRAENYNRIYDIGHRINLAGVIKDEIPYCIQGDGLLMKFTGGGFEEEARLPIANGGVLFDDAVKAIWDDAQTIPRMVHPNGIAVVEGQIHILLSAAVSGVASQLLEEMASGIWVYDEDVGLHHRYSLSQYDGTLNDYGTSVINIPGFLIPTFDANKFICGAGIFSDNASTEVKAIFRITETVADGNRGHFITRQLLATGIQDIFQKLITKHKQLGDSDDRIVIKYRIIKNKNMPFRAAITWSDTDTFTSTDSDFANASAGDEVEIFMGKGAGAIAHIDSISEDGGTFTVNLKETITGVSGTAQVRVNNWKSIKSISNVAKRFDETKLTDDASKWIQFKVELRGDLTGAKTGPEIEEIIAIFAKHLGEEPSPI